MFICKVFVKCFVCFDCLRCSNKTIKPSLYNMASPPTYFNDVLKTIFSQSWKLLENCYQRKPPENATMNDIYIHIRANSFGPKASPVKETTMRARNSVWIRHYRIWHCCQKTDIPRDTGQQGGTIGDGRFWMHPAKLLRVTLWYSRCDKNYKCEMTVTFFPSLKWKGMLRVHICFWVSF